MRAFLVLLLLVVIFHRPLFHTALRLALIKVAARQNVTLDVHFAGTIFTNLDVRDVTAYPTGKAPSPVEKITIESVRLEYSLPMLFKHGVGEFLRSYEIKNGDLRLLAFPSKDEEERQQKHSLARDLNNLLAQPALYADRVRVENLNIRVTAPDNVTEVEGVHLFLHPEQLGYLRVARLKVPGLPAWENLSAQTSYAQRNLYLRGLVLDPQLVINEFNFDASQRAQRRGNMMLKGTVFGGTLQAWLEGSALPKKGENLESSYSTTLRLDAGGVDLRAATAYFAKKDLPIGKLQEMHLNVVGEPEKPRTWNGKIDLRVGSLSAGKLSVESIGATADIKDGVAQISTGDLEVGQNAITFTGTAQLPESVNDFSKTEGDAQVRLRAPDLLELTSTLFPAQPIGGLANGNAKVSFRDRRLTADVSLDGQNVGNTQYGATKIKLRGSLTKDVDVKGDTPFAGLETDLSANLADLRYQTFTADSATIDGSIRNELVTVRTGEVVRGDNRVDVHGTYRFPSKTNESAPIDANFSIKVPDLAAFGIRVKDAALGGSLTGEGSLKSVNDTIGGNIVIRGNDISLGDFTVKYLASKIDVANDEASIEELRLQLANKDQIAATGKVGLKKPLPYEGALLVLIKDLKVLQPLLATFDVQEPITGSVDMSIEGSGQIQPQKHEGQLKLAVEDAKYGKLDLKEIRLSGLYGPEFAESTQLHLVSGITSLEGVLEWRDAKLKLRDINLKQGSIQALTGYIIVPFDPTTPETLIPLDRRIAANVNAHDLDIEKFLSTFGQTSPVTGKVTANLVAGGTFLVPMAHLKVSASQLKAKSMAKLDAAQVDLTAHYSDKELTLDAIARQREIQPLTVKGRFPLDLEATLQQKKLDPNLPLDLTVKLPRTALNVLPKFVPKIRRAEGTATIDAKIVGTVEKPQFSGAAGIRLEYARIEGEGIPQIGKMTADVAFANDGLKIRTLRGEIGGGTFDLSGGVQVPRWFEPIFDLRLRSDDVLVKRDESVTVRLDTDVRATGPLKAGAVKGTVWVTQSRFFREIDILPIGLPGRPKSKPAPKSVASTSTFAIDTPPFRDWTFDVAIKTRPNDLFQIRSNLANGGAAIDLKLAGTGGAPYLEGMIRIDNFVASLPFSRLNVTRGFITFSKDAPFEPKLDLLAESRLRDYHISANIYGNAKDPQISLTSEPPLPQQDIVSLLATGTTTSELTSSPDVLAGRAAVLLFQELSSKVFKRRSPTENIPMLDRFNVDIGNVDNRTGRQEISTSFKLGENFYLVGDLDVTGEFAGRIRYLVRFR